MSYSVYKFTVTPIQPGSEIIMAFISDFEFESFENTETGFNAYIKNDLVQNSEIDTYLKNLIESSEINFAFTIEEIENKNWNEEWEKNFEPAVIDDILCIHAPFHRNLPNTKYKILIEPKMSFGTGHHQTTRLVCGEMFEVDLKGKDVLDVGCGTGILSIWAKKLGADYVQGIDIDEWSYLNAIENCKLNGFGNMEINQCGIEKIIGDKKFDLIVANINKNVLKAQIFDYAKLMNKGAELILSGFFTADAEELISCCKSNSLEFVYSENEEEWCVLRLGKI